MPAEYRPRTSPGTLLKFEPVSKKADRPITVPEWVQRKECDRLKEVAHHEPTQRRSFVNHLGTKSKRRRSPGSAKRKDESPLFYRSEGPNFVISRSKTRVETTLKFNDNRVDVQPNPPTVDQVIDSYRPLLGDDGLKTRLSSAGRSKSSHSAKYSTDDLERVVKEMQSRAQSACHLDEAYSQASKMQEALIRQLQEEISTLTVRLEEERLDCTEKLQQATVKLEQTLELLNEEHAEEIRSLTESFEEELGTQIDKHEREVEDVRDEYSEQIDDLKGELETVRASFEVFKLTLTKEMEEKWVNEQRALIARHNEEKAQALSDLRQSLTRQADAEMERIRLETESKAEKLKKDHRKETDRMVRRFMGSAEEAERAKSFEKQIALLEDQLRDTQQLAEELTVELARKTSDLADVKFELAKHEKSQLDKMKLIEKQFDMKMNNLIAENIDLKRLFVRKCSELFTERLKIDNEASESLSSVKDLLNSLIGKRVACDIPLTSEEASIVRQLVGKLERSRPTSAPTTKFEDVKSRFQAADKSKFAGQQQPSATESKLSGSEDGVTHFEISESEQVREWRDALFDGEQQGRKSELLDDKRGHFPSPLELLQNLDSGGGTTAPQ